MAEFDNRPDRPSALPRPHLDALLATARVCGLGTLAIGVGSGCSPGRGPGTSPAAVGDAPAASATQEPGPTAAPVAEAPSPTAPSATPPSSPPSPLAACQATVANGFDAEGALRADADEAAVLDCCDRIAKDHDSRGEMWDGEYRGVCCEALDWVGSVACTPWGPPAPPPLGTESVSYDAAGTLDVTSQTRGIAGPALGTLGAQASEKVRSAAIETWRMRMLNETVSARVFEALAVQLERAGFSTATVERWAAFADEERRHGLDCGRVVEALGGKARAHRPALPHVPGHDDVDARQALLRNVLSISCLSETVAVSLIGAERNEMPDGPLRELLTEIYADEVGHAAEGWRLLSAVLAAEPERKADLRAYLSVAIEHLFEHELAHLPADARATADSKQWGLCDGLEMRALFTATVEHVITPGLTALLAEAA